MKRFSLLLFAAILSTVMMAQRKETTILEVAGNLATPLTVHTSKGTYTVYSSTELNGSVSVRSAEDANGNKVVVPNGDYKSHTSNGRSEYTRIYRFKTLYNNSSSSPSSSNSYGSRNNGGSSNGEGSYSNRCMPYEHLRDIAKRSDNIYGTWYHHREELALDMYFETLIKITPNGVVLSKSSKIKGESSRSTLNMSILSASNNEIVARYKAPRDYNFYAGDKINGRTVAYDETCIDFSIKLVDGEIYVTSNTVISLYDRNGNYISEEHASVTKADRYLSVPEQF